MMASAIWLCLDCDNLDGRLQVSGTTMSWSQYWHIMECPECQAKWHVCLIHIVHWKWVDAGLTMHHFHKIYHALPGDIPSQIKKWKLPNLLCGTESTIPCPLPDTSTIFMDDNTEISSISCPLVQRKHFTDQHSCLEPNLSSLHGTCNTNNYRSMLAMSTTPNASVWYFENEILHRGFGIQGLIGGAFRNSQISKVMANDMKAQFHLMLLSLLKDFTGAQQETLLGLVNCLRSNPKMWLNTRLPTCVPDARIIYMQGTHSMYQNIPRPAVHSHSNHACVQLHHVIGHLLVHGIVFDNLDRDAQNNECGNYPVSVKDTKAVKSICKQVSQYYNGDTPMVLYITFWSDNFEVTHVKSTSSVWIHTVTVCPPPDQATSPRYTHALPISQKVEKYDSILAMYHHELKELNKCNSMYDGNTKKMIPVIVKLLVIAADCPE